MNFSMLSFISLDNIISGVGSPDRLIIGLGALILNGIFGYAFGPAGGNANPYIWRLLDGSLGEVARKSYRKDRAAGDLAFRGILFTLFFMIFALIIGTALYSIKLFFNNNHFLELVFLSLALSGGSVWLSLVKLYRALGEGAKLETGSFYPIAVSTRTNLNSTDDFGIARIGIGFMPVSFDKGVVAPLFWYLFGGLPMAFLYNGVAAAKWAFAKNGFAKGFGDFVIQMDALLGVVPHVISAILLQVAALFTPTAHMTKTVSSFFTRKGKADYAEGGLPLNVTAWALNVSLGGPVEDRDGSVLKHNWIGPDKASAKVEKGHLKRAIYMNVMAYILLCALLLAGLLIWRQFGWV